jgi:outer membrane protein OmpA-like peptidoglycan-associated protein
VHIVLPADALFGLAGETLQSAAEPTLQQVALLIAKLRPEEVVVAGHTDSTGGDDNNLALSEQRARVVSAWLEAHAAKRQPRYIERGYGRTRPLAPNHHPDGSPDPAAQQRNRRIEITIRR